MSVKIEIVGGTLGDMLEQLEEAGVAAGHMIRERQRAAEALVQPPSVLQEPLAPDADPYGQGPAPAVTLVPDAPPLAPLAPPATDAPPLAPAPAVLDSQGQPWDERIHSRNKSIKKDGSWTVKRGAPAALIVKVRAEHAAAAVAAPPVAVAPEVIAPPPGAPDVASTIALCSRLLAAGKTPEMVASISAQIHSAMLEAGLTDGANSLLANPQAAPAIHEKLRQIGLGIGLEC